jgi:hypothetical protein
MSYNGSMGNLRGKGLLTLPQTSYSCDPAHPGDLAAWGYGRHSFGEGVGGEVNHHRVRPFRNVYGKGSWI